MEMLTNPQFRIIEYLFMNKSDVDPRKPQFQDYDAFLPDILKSLAQFGFILSEKELRDELFVLQEKYKMVYFTLTDKSSIIDKNGNQKEVPRQAKWLVYPNGLDYYKKNKERHQPGRELIK